MAVVWRNVIVEEEDLKIIFCIGVVLVSWMVIDVSEWQQFAAFRIEQNTHYPHIIDGMIYWNGALGCSCRAQPGDINKILLPNFCMNILVRKAVEHTTRNIHNQTITIKILNSAHAHIFGLADIILIQPLISH